MTGIVNDQFYHIQTLKTLEESDRVVQLINAYCIDVERILSEFESYMEYPEVNFSYLESLAYQIEERSLHIGVEHMRLACASLIQACTEMHKRKFFHAVSWMKNEFVHTRNKLQAFVQIERKIARLERKQQK